MWVKAKNLRARMRQYVTLQDERQKIPLMMQLVASFDYIVVETEHEALVLERNLIGQYHPYFNVDLKDDKSYPFIAITKSDLFPAIKYTRERHKPGTRYFGPYTDSRAARETIDTLRKVIPICSASCAEWRRCRRIVESHKGEEDIVNMICAQTGVPALITMSGAGRAHASARFPLPTMPRTSNVSNVSCRAIARMSLTSSRPR